MSKASDQAYDQLRRRILSGELAQRDSDWAEALMIAHIRGALHARVDPVGHAG